MIGKISKNQFRKNNVLHPSKTNCRKKTFWPFYNKFQGKKISTKSGKIEAWSFPNIFHEVIVAPRFRIDVDGFFWEKKLKSLGLKSENGAKWSFMNFTKIRQV